MRRFWFGHPLAEHVLAEFGWHRRSRPVSLQSFRSWLAQWHNPDRADLQGFPLDLANRQSKFVPGSVEDDREKFAALDRSPIRR